MTTVYRAHSPSRDDTHGLTEDRDEMVATVAVLNQGRSTGPLPARLDRADRTRRMGDTMTEYITGRQARKLLDGTTPGPWEVEDQSPKMGGRSFVIRQAEVPGIRVQGTTYGFNNDPELLAAAPSLAETVAWLYERIREIHNDQRCWADAYRARIEWDPEGKDPARLARAEAHDDCADMLATLLDDEGARDGVDR